MSIKRSLMIAQFPGGTAGISGGATAWQTARWVAKLAAHLENDERISRVLMKDYCDTPITMTRNLALVDAENESADYVLMVDSDMVPDMYIGDSETAKPFFQSSFDFMLQHDLEGHGPCVVAAPYCGPPPHENTMFFRWTEFQNDDPSKCEFAIELWPRYDAVRLKGIIPVAAIGTGLMLIDMRAVARLSHPRFYYEWKDKREIQKASTEDVTFTRDLTLLDPPVPIYANMDAWAGHIKRKIVGMPEEISPQSIPRNLRRAAKAHAIEGIDEPPVESRVRAENTFRHLPKGYPIELVATRRLMPESPIDDEGPIDIEKIMSAAAQPCPNGTP